MGYWDSSCLVKLHVREVDSAIFKAHMASGAAVVTSAIARLELWATFRRKELIGELTVGGARRALQAFDRDVTVGRVVVEAMSAAAAAEFDAIIDQCYSLIPPLQLRTLDAIHLATASVTGETEVVATDRRLRDAALAQGFQVFPPP